MRVILTRAQDDAERSADKLRARGYDPVLCPVLDIAPTGPAIDASGHDALIATSAKAFFGWSARLEEERADALRLPLYAVGAQTAQAARRAGFRDVRIAPEGDAASLADLIALTAPKGARLLWLAGRDRKPQLESALSGRFPLDVIEVYEARPAPALPASATAALREGDAVVLHYSARSARIFLDLARDSQLDPARPGLRHAALSADAAHPLEAAGAKASVVAARPDEEALISALLASCPPYH